MILHKSKFVNPIKILSVFIFVFGFLSCFMHFTEEIPPNQIHDGKENYLTKRHLPIKLRLDRSNIPKSITVDVLGSVEGQLNHNPDYPKLNSEIIAIYIENFYSEEILAKFKMNELFISNPDSNVLVEIKPRPIKIEIFDPAIDMTANSFGMTPLPKKSYGQITFELIDLSKNEKIKDYTYNLSHNSYEGYSMFLFSPFLPLFSDYIDHSSNERTFSIMRRAYEAFYRDLTYDLSRDPKLLASFYINDSPHYSVQLKETDKEKEFNPLFLSAMESSLISKGFQLFDVEKSYSDKINIDRNILIENLIFERDLYGKKEISSIRYVVTCQDLKSGKILWKQNIFYSPNRKGLMDHEIIQIAAQELLNQLSLNGDI